MQNLEFKSKKEKRNKDKVNKRTFSEVKLPNTTKRND